MTTTDAAKKADIRSKHFNLHTMTAAVQQAYEVSLGEETEVTKSIEGTLDMTREQMLEALAQFVNEARTRRQTIEDEISRLQARITDTEIAEDWALDGLQTALAPGYSRTVCGTFTIQRRRGRETVVHDSDTTPLAMLPEAYTRMTPPKPAVVQLDKYAVLNAYKDKGEDALVDGLKVVRKPDTVGVK